MGDEIVLPSASAPGEVPRADLAERESGSGRLCLVSEVCHGQTGKNSQLDIWVIKDQQAEQSGATRF